MFPLPLFYYFEFAAFVASVIFLNNAIIKQLKWFRYFLGFIILVELSARYIRKILHEPNVWIYNISIPLEYLFYTAFFYTVFSKVFYKQIAKGFFIVYSAFVLSNIFFIQGIGIFNSYSVLIGSLFMILLSGMLLNDIFLHAERSNILLNSVFWIAAGVLLFNAGEFAYHLLSSYLINDEIDKAARFFASINNKLILVLYSCITIAFICSMITGKYKKE